MYKKLRKDIDIRVEGYCNYIDDYISSESHSYPLIRYSDNIDKVWTRGAELEFNRCTDAGLGVYFNYNFYLVDWFDDSLEIEPFLMELTPRHRFNTGLTYSVFNSTSFTLDSRAAIGRHSKSGLEMDDYFILNFGAEQGFFDQKFMINLRVENIVDVDYHEIYGYPMPGRTFTLHASCSL